MKNLLVLLFSVAMLPASAADYYFANSGNDATGNGSQATPYATITKLNTLTLSAGDRVLFKRGDTFYGSITLSGSGGTSGSSVTFTAYGTGALPVISGFTQLSQNNADWTQVATNVWETNAAVTNGLTAQMNVVMLNGAVQKMGRYPNQTVFGGDWLRWESHTGDSSITDLQLSTTTNWTGAQAVVRTTDFTVDTGTIILHRANPSGAGSRLSLPYEKMYDPNYSPSGIMFNNFGYFIQNDVRTLDTHGEWFYNKSTKKFRIYLSSSPSNHTIKVPTQTRGLYISGGRDWCVVENLRFEGFNTDGLAMNSAALNTMIRDCEFQYMPMGVNHLDGNSDNTSIHNCVAFDIMNVAFYGRNCNNFTVRECHIKRVGLWHGLGQSGQGLLGVWGQATGGTYARNIIDSTGYACIRTEGSDMRIDSNLVKNYCLLMADGSAIYIGNNKTFHTNRKVRRNIILNGHGNMLGTNHESLTVPNTTSATVNTETYGIYPDDYASDIEVAHNVIYGIKDAAMLLHNNRALNIHDNLFVGGGNQVLFISSNSPLIDTSSHYKIWGMQFKNNTLVAKNRWEWVIKSWYRADSAYYRIMDEDRAAATTANLVDGWNDNMYARPVNQDSITVNINWNYGLANSTTRNWKNPEWISRMGMDTRTVGSPKYFASNSDIDTVFYFHYNPSLSDSTITLARTLMDMQGNVHFAGEQYTMPSFSGALFLAHTATAPTPPSSEGDAVAGYVIYTDKDGKLYRNPRTGKLLVRTVYYDPQNLFTYSEQLDHANWVKTDAGVVVTADATTAPDGTTSADLIAEADGVTGSRHIRQTAPVTINKSYTFSAYVKNAGRDYVQMAFSSSGGAYSGAAYANFDLTTGAVTLQGSAITDARITDEGSGWYRISITAQALATSATHVPFIKAIPTPTASRNISYAGTSGKDFYLWGMQFNEDLRRPYSKTEATSIP